MLTDFSAACVAVLIFVSSYLLPLVVLGAAAQLLPGVELNVVPDGFYDWVIFLVGTAALLRIAESVGQWVRGQALAFERTRPYSVGLALLAEALLDAAFFRLLISSLTISLLCSVLFTSLAYYLERKLGSLEDS